MVFNSKQAEDIQPWFSKEAAASDINLRSDELIPSFH